VDGALLVPRGDAGYRISATRCNFERWDRLCGDATRCGPRSVRVLVSVTRAARRAARGRARAGRLAAAAAALAVPPAASCERFRPGGPRKSQPALVMQQMGDTKLTVTYNRPVARGRVLFGGIVPFGRAWDPGADEATTLAVSRDVRFGGQPLSAGTYSVWAIPDSTTWTLILSTASRVPHTPYPEGRDALRVVVAPARAPHMEALAFYFPVADSAHALLALHWGETRVEVPVARP
jgi:hypothetical protein